MELYQCIASLSRLYIVHGRRIGLPAATSGVKNVTPRSIRACVRRRLLPRTAETAVVEVVAGGGHHHLQ